MSDQKDENGAATNGHEVIASGSMTELVETAGAVDSPVADTPSPEATVADQEHSDSANPNAFQGQIGCFRFSFNLRVFIASGIVIWGFVIWYFSIPLFYVNVHIDIDIDVVSNVIRALVHEEAGSIIADVQEAIVKNFSW